MKTKAKRFTRGVHGLVTLAATTLIADRALAQSGFALERFEPSERGSEWFVAESLDFRGDPRPIVGIVAAGSFRPLALYDSDGSLRESIVRDQVFLHLGAAVAVAELIRVSLNFPIAVFQDGHAGTVDGMTYQPPRKQSVGDIRIAGDLRIAGQSGDPAVLALGVRAFIPTGSREDFTGDGQLRMQFRALLAGDVGGFVYAAQAGFHYRGLDETVAGVALGSEVTFAAAAGARLADRNLVIGPEVFGSSVVTGDAAFSKKTTPVDALIGLHYTLGNVRLGAAGGAGLTSGFGSATARWVACLEWVPAIVERPIDTDMDGIPDTTDACPAQPGVKTEDPKTNGCPLKTPPPDRDGDGIVDAEDACPDVRGVASADPKLNGCPKDGDKDGIPDESDACPEVAGVKTDDPKTNGCPADADQDGVIDAEDACPKEPGRKTTDPQTNGCPDPDRDKDGIVNDQDACPDQAGKANPDPQKNGCPTVYVQGSQIKITEQVKFASGSAVIVQDKTTQAVLEGIFTILKEHPEIEKVSVEGHTDNQGGAAFNKKLSAQRAAAVAKWLVGRGIDAKRFNAVGHGMEQPIDDNGTPEGRKNNRRVEFNIESAQ
jgi:outer membrane protein OmpA-like peptidoglycan-associated protein